MQVLTYINIENEDNWNLYFYIAMYLYELLPLFNSNLKLISRSKTYPQVSYIQGLFQSNL